GNYSVTYQDEILDSAVSVLAYGDQNQAVLTVQDHGFGFVADHEDHRTVEADGVQHRQGRGRSGIRYPHRGPGAARKDQDDAQSGGPDHRRPREKGGPWKKRVRRSRRHEINYG